MRGYWLLRTWMKPAAQPSNGDNPTKLVQYAVACDLLDNVTDMTLSGLRYNVHKTQIVWIVNSDEAGIWMFRYPV